MRVKSLKSLKSFEISFEDPSVLQALQAKQESLTNKLFLNTQTKEEITRTREYFTSYVENDQGTIRKNVTAILGPNGHGKSTILHALASCFKPVTESGEDYRFNQFFPSYNGNPWGEMDLEIVHSYRDQNQQIFHYHSQSYLRKDPSSNKDVRWPIANRRAARDVIYFGMDKCIPLIEVEAQKKSSGQAKDWLPEPIQNLELLKYMGQCLNKNYDSLLRYLSKEGKEFIGINQRGLNYSALTMSGGEQKVYHLLKRIFEAQKYSLILIDELDLLLHDLAFEKLLDIICRKAKEKCLQVIFTTHREVVTKFANQINIRHICNEQADKTMCFEATTPALIERLTGAREKSLEIFVEDDLAEAVVKQVVRKMGISRDSSIIKVGPAGNLFTAMTGLLFKNDRDIDVLKSNSLFLLDGDVCRNEGELEKQIKKTLSGNGWQAESLRNKVYESRIIRSLNLPERKHFPEYRSSDKKYLSPEEFMHALLIRLDQDSSQDPEIIKLAQSIQYSVDSHGYLDEIVKKIDHENRSNTLTRIVSVLLSSNSPSIEDYLRDLNDWLHERKQALMLG